MNWPLRSTALIVLLMFISVPLGLNYCSTIFFDLGQYGSYIGGVAALFALILAIIEFQFYKTTKVDERIIQALIVARKFIYALQYLASPFSSTTHQIEGEPYPERLIRERNERMEVVEKDFNEFINISRDADLYLSNEELEIFETLHEIWKRTKVGFKMHVMFLSQEMAHLSQNEKAYNDAFIQDELKTKLDDSLKRLTTLIKNLNERYKKHPAPTK